MVMGDAGVRGKIRKAMSSRALTGTTRIEQDEYEHDNFRFAYGALDCVHWSVSLPLAKRKFATPVVIEILDYYEFHPGRSGVSQCAHAACVELVALGKAKNFWTKGAGAVAWGDMLKGERDKVWEAERTDLRRCRMPGCLGHLHPLVPSSTSSAWCCVASAP
jgi:hypothetical protein